MKNKENEERDALQAAAVPVLSLLRKQVICFQGGCMSWVLKCDTLLEAAVACVSIHPFHSAF